MSGNPAALPLVAAMLAILSLVITVTGAAWGRQRLALGISIALSACAAVVLATYGVAGCAQ